MEINIYVEEKIIKLCCLLCLKSVIRGENFTVNPLQVILD
jgi:hypothetical protein